MSILAKISGRCFVEPLGLVEVVKRRKNPGRRFTLRWLVIGRAVRCLSVIIMVYLVSLFFVSVFKGGGDKGKEYSGEV